MRYVTRFNPTTSGGKLHIGHLYVALVNATEAHRTNGKFIVRIDDNQPYWVWKHGVDGCRKLGEDYVNDLAQFMPIDLIEYQSELPDIREYFPSDVYNVLPKVRFLHDYHIDWIADRDMSMYPYAPCFTMEKVVWDFMDGVNQLIRGEDLGTEAGLYDFFCDLLGFPIIWHTYLPRLRSDKQAELGVTEVSKTFRNYQISRQIETFGVEQTLEFLKQSCLIDPQDEFRIENIKCSPTVVGFVP